MRALRTKAILINEKYMANNYFIVESNAEAGSRPQAVSHKEDSGVVSEVSKGILRSASGNRLLNRLLNIELNRSLNRSLNMSINWAMNI